MAQAETGRRRAAQDSAAADAPRSRRFPRRFRSVSAPVWPGQGWLKLLCGGERLLQGERTSGGSNPSQHAVMAWRELPVPLIAAVHGVAYGGGLQLMLAADLRFVAADTRLSIMEINWGLLPDMGGMVLLRGLVRDDVARELTFTGRVFSGSEAQQLGLASRVSVDPYAEELALAREIAARPPKAMRAAKRLLDLAQQADAKAILLAESREQAALIGAAEQVEAVKARLEKRPAVFAD